MPHHYADIFIFPVPVKTLEPYRDQAETFTGVWRDNAALSCVELEADDAPLGKLASFPQSVDLKPDEKVLSAWPLISRARSATRSRPRR